MEITVDLGPRSYPVILVRNSSGDFAGTLRRIVGDRRFALVTNTTVRSLYAEHIERWERELGGRVCHTVEDGERYKTVDTWRSMLDTLLEARLDRRSIVIAFGGGVVGDIAGFAAASVLRGVDFVQIPTTLLAMVDSSVGGKVGVDHARGKNLIGAFHQPCLVWADVAYLDTLSRRQFVSGYAELFKYAFVGGREMFDFVCERHEDLIRADAGALMDGIARSVRIKAAVVQEDERESSGKRALLNFGHTFAHALEQYFGYEGILHGEAVLWGMRCACDLGSRVGTIPRESRGEYEAMLDKIPRVDLPRTPEPEALYAAMFSDKKAQGGTLRFVLPAEPGTSVIRADVSAETVVKLLTEHLQER